MKTIVYLAILALVAAFIGNMLSGCMSDPTNMRTGYAPSDTDECFDANGNAVQQCPPLMQR